MTAIVGLVIVPTMLSMDIQPAIVALRMPLVCLAVTTVTSAMVAWYAINLATHGCVVTDNAGTNLMGMVR